MARTRPHDSVVDPLDRALQPPVDEGEEERKARLVREKEAKVVSDAIDHAIEVERAQEKKTPKPVKVLLLGQSESGKSTTLKNFQLMYEPKAFRRERPSWRAVIQLNVVRSFHVVMDAITRSHKASQNPASVTFSSLNDIITIPQELLQRNARLRPLLDVEATLTRRLTPHGSGETEATQRIPSGERPKNRLGEVAVNSTKQWKKLLAHDGDETDDSDGIDWDDPEDPGNLIHALSEDMIKLWTDPITQAVLEEQDIRMQELAGFFLDQLDRVTGPRYIPSDDDILKARLKTLGVTEHRFTLASTGSISRDWRIFDVGGHRSQRAAWVPYFDDMDSIIFLAPISCFDQTLAEAPKINRLADSVTIWSEVSAHKLLENTNLILFLNKVDIFRAKLAAGTKLADYIVSYGKRANDFESTTTYLRKKFSDILKDKSPLPRVFYSHFTTVTDPKSTRYILANLKEIFIREHLAQTDLVL